MRIVVAGAGEVGSHLAKMLNQERHDITVISDNEERLNALTEEADVITVLGSPTSIEILTKAGVTKADLFIAVSPEHEQDINIVSAILAKKLGAKKVTARINNREYLRNENKILFTDMGIDSIFCPESIAANEIIDILRQNTSEFMRYGHDKLQLLVHKLKEGAPMIDHTVGELKSETVNLLRSVAISRNNETIIPTSDTKFKLHDQVYIISKKEGIEKAMSLSGKDAVSTKRIMILGGGRIGELVARHFEKQAERITLIDIKPERCKYLSETLNKTLVINGDGRNSDLLIEEGLKDVDVLISVTSSSETNILSCVIAKSMGVPRVLSEVENLEYIKLAEEMGVDSVINKKLITAGRIYRFTMSNKVRSIKVLTGTDAEVLEFIVNTDSKITAGKLKDIEIPQNSIIGGYIRGNESYIANADSEIKPYDQVVVFACPNAISKVDKLFL